MDTLETLRKQIDIIDDQILILLQKRISLMGKIGEEKKNLKKPIRDNEREQQKLREIEKKATALNIPKELIRNVWKLFFEMSEEIEK
jgi:chorismate mutase